MDESVSDWAEVTRELVGLWDTSVNDVTIGRREGLEIGFAVYSLTAHSYATAKAVLHACEAGDVTATAPLVRTVLECALTAVWVEAMGVVAARALVHEEARNHKAAIEEFLRAGLASSEEALARAKSLMDNVEAYKMESGRYIKQRCADIEGGPRLYAVYRGLSPYCHASTSLTNLYLRELESSGSETEYEISPSPRPLDFLPQVVPIMLVHSGLAWSRLEESHPNRRRLRELARAYGVSDKFTLSVAGMRRQREAVRADREARRQANGTSTTHSDVSSGGL